MGQALLPIAAVAMVAGTAMSYQGNKTAAKAAETSANYTASQQAVQAGQDVAASQKLAEQDRQTTRLAESTANAIGSAGGGAADVSNVKNIGRIAARGEYNALTDLYNGQEAARGANTAAAVTKYEGQQQKTAYDTGAVTALLKGVSGGSSLFSKYGGGGFGGTGL